MRAWIPQFIVPGALFALAVAGCQSSKPAVCSAPQGDEAAAQSLAQDGTKFALAFYPPAAAAVGAGKNVILSPYSASAALTMLDVGAAGKTASQIETVLDLPAGGTAVAPTYATLTCDDMTHGSADGNQLSVANALWGQTGMSFQPAFLSTLADGYSAPLQQVDFEKDSAGATSTIDSWVSSATQGAIPKLFQPSDLDASTRLVLVNAVYFKGTWAKGFDASATGPQAFTLADGTLAQVPTMNGNVDVAQGKGTGFSVVEVPYQGNQIAIDFLVPDGDLSALESSLTADALQAALGGLGKQSGVSLFLPKFTFGTRVVLNPVLSGMGMSDVFMPGVADLSGIDGQHDLYVSLVVQQATIEVDEVGTVAAAATGVAVETDAVATPPTVQIDHPFLFLLRDTSTGSLLFMGRVLDPRAAS